jgi:hypothetical protein
MRSRRFCFPTDALPHGELVLQTKLQTNNAAQDGIRDHKAGFPEEKWQTGTHA